MMRLSAALLFVLFFWISGTSFAQTLFSNTRGATLDETQNAVTQNQLYHSQPNADSQTRPFRPVQDTADFSYVLFSADDLGQEEFLNMRRTIAEKLPGDLKLVILADTSDVQKVRAEYLKWISGDRLIIAAAHLHDTGVWARDAFPYPVYDNAMNLASLVAVNYFRDFTSWDAIADSVSAQMVKKNFTFVGGNLLGDDEGNCFVVKSERLFGVTEEDLKSAYGCHVVHYMEHIHGIGDVDEVLKPLSGHRILTDTVEYQSELEALGYQVIFLPLPNGKYRTYVNSLIAKDVVFMPSYGVDDDAVAIAVYESLGYTVIPIRSNVMSDIFQGSVHCQTMGYPQMSEPDLMKALGTNEIQ